MQIERLLFVADQYFVTPVKYARASVVLRPSVPVNLQAKAFRITESPQERKAIREVGAYRIARSGGLPGELIEFEWKVGGRKKHVINVHSLQSEARGVYICVAVNQKQWYAVGKLAGGLDPYTLEHFFGRRYSRSGFGFYASKVLPARLVNHRPDLLAPNTVINAYGRWLWQVTRKQKAFFADVWDRLRVAGVPLHSPGETRLRTELSRRYRERPSCDIRKEPLPSVTRDDLAIQMDIMRRAMTFHLGQAEAFGRELSVRLRDTDQIRECAEVLETLCRTTQSGESRSRYLLILGNLLDGGCAYEAAIATYGQGLALEPTDEFVWYSLHNNIGYCHNQLGSFQNAEWYCRAAIAIDPTRHNAYKNLGVALHGQFVFVESAWQFITAVRLCPADRRALDHLEQLFRDHPQLDEEIEGFPEILESCRKAVDRRRRAQQTTGKPE